jgi:CheY-like chemotaxis protein
LGLGLTLAKRLIELHGGRIEVHSEGHGRGSQYFVRIPLHVPVAGDAGRPATPSARQGDPVRRRILVVDDVRASASTLAMMLERIGQEVLVAHDGSEAIEQVAARHPDVVFLDIAMPGMSGYDVARHLRADPRTTHLVLVALTGYGNQEDRRRSMNAGFDHHLTKPTSIEELAALLRSLPNVPRPAGSPSLAD